MKGILRSKALQAVITGLAAGYLKLVLPTLRVREEGRAALDAVMFSGDRGVILCLWHGAIALSVQPWLRPRGTYPELRVLISRSRDGALIAAMMERFNVHAIRGSRAKEASRAREKGGAEAMREMVSWIKAGKCVAITPDGPRGPARKMGDGAGMTARLSGGQVLLLGMAASPAIRLDTWDRTCIPLPFARAALVWSGPFEAGPDNDLSALTATWEAELNRATDRAEALMA